MGLIQRPVKHLGTRTYQTEVAINPNDPILDNEVDGDLDTIYGEFNGRITNANVDPAAAISTAKIAPDGHLTTAHLDPNAGILDTQLAHGGAHVNGAGSAGLTVTAGGGQSNWVVLPAITTRGGLVMLQGNLAATWATLGATSANVIIRIFRDATQIAVATYGVQAAGAETLPIPCPAFVDPAATPGTFVYAVTAEVTGTGVFATGASPGSFCATELA